MGLGCGFKGITNSTNLLGIIRCGVAPHPLPCSIARAPAKAVALELRPRVGVGLIVEQDLQPILFNVVHNGSASERRLDGHVLSRSLELFNPCLDAPYLRTVVRQRKLWVRLMVTARHGCPHLVDLSLRQRRVWGLRRATCRRTFMTRLMLRHEKKVAKRRLKIKQNIYIWLYC